LSQAPPSEAEHLKPKLANFFAMFLLSSAVGILIPFFKKPCSAPSFNNNAL